MGITYLNHKQTITIELRNSFLTMMNGKSFSFQTKFLLDDVPFSLEVSSKETSYQRTMEEAGISEMQVITFGVEDSGVSMGRGESLAGESQFQLTGYGLLEDADEEELTIFATVWLLMVQEGLRSAVREHDGATALANGEGIAVDPALLLGAKEFLEIMEHFFPGMF